MALITTNAADLLLYTGLVGSTTVAFNSTFAGAKLILAAAAFTPSKTRVLADITQPTYTGYAPQTITWGAAATYDTTGQVAVFGNLLTFKATSGTVNIQVFGYGITNSGGTSLFAMELFASAFNLQDLNATVNIVPSFPLQVSQTASAIVFT